MSSYLLHGPWYLFVALGMFLLWLSQTVLRRRRLERLVAREFARMFVAKIGDAAVTASMYHQIGGSISQHLGYEWRPAGLIERGIQAVSVVDDLQRLQGKGADAS
tara:strand:+ start:332 stop:646 length:315 start_codon:yes stop_codon:yes gene_type:complete